MTIKRAAEIARLEAEGRALTLQRWRELIGIRSAAALRELLGLTPSRAAALVALPLAAVRDFERGTIDPQLWKPVSRGLHFAFAGAGGGWCDPELHDGAYCVTLAGSRLAGATDRQAIRAALALMGHRAQPPRRRVGMETLAKRVAGRLAVPVAEVRAELGGRVGLSDRVRAEAFRQLGGGPIGAGCYFLKGDAGGWREVGCDYAGCWW